VTYVYLWRFTVRAGSEAAFELAYGPNGEWVRLFREADGYLGTELLRDAARQRTYVTVDRWSSREAWDAFRAARAEEWDAIDRRCQALTADEEEIGRYEAVER
jgi:heme-degrading monooxygenase HmoA